ncbi:uncharacterized protein LOC116430581 [Nomia melanderi]|uniref:uncharacterized protein LOC116430581 n=1 Tax=Nomia melanderi TaxID=2448451 RepID=UPI0013040D25|nr:uncharacterized protein LOC116430581 [Nomia melanderi]
MSIQMCGRDQRKMMQVIEQIKVLANNLEDLREEIGALRNNHFLNDGNVSTDKRIYSTKSHILHKLRKSTKKIGPTDLQKNERKPPKESEVCCHRSIQDVSLFSSLKYMFRFGKRSKPLRISAYLKDESSQTDKTSNKSNSRSVFNKKASAKKQTSLFQQISDISCELDSHVDDATFSDIHTVPTKISPHGKELCLFNENRPLTTVCTQTSSPKPWKKRRSFNFQSKHPNFYFSKIKNAVITKKIIRNPSENAFTVCGRVIRGGYPNLNQKLREDCSCRTKRINDDIKAITRGTYENDSQLSSNVQRLNSSSPLIEDNMADNSTTEEESGATSSTSVLLNLEVNVSNSSTKTEEFRPRRKPRTYTLNKQFQERDRNDRCERIFYVGPTSDLTLSSHSSKN